jgi:hypothetical protein
MKLAIERCQRWLPSLQLSLLRNVVRIGSDLAWSVVRHDDAAIRERF